ncbi:hypothetical protein S40285_09740 [Stachybotrys chlorohalonatus IBT 40285]|uniref:Ig-like domain-containing protein n=1 Tax=Stachybotrys chlorohalonatus (strain IBT 40285) TaxID=1283841 RepID=A0A084Q886_STAC4|nr:hypothetical protein S40285_09740 [Stachybotrys chlorohalonata IBT 40285]
MLSTIVLAGALALVQGAMAMPSELNDRAACNRDNLLRCFVDVRFSASASAYCSGLTPTTVTASTVQATATVTSAPALEQRSDDLWIAADLGVGFQKRAAPLPSCAATYSPQRLTSACNCINVPAATVSVTATTIVSTVTVTPTPPVNNWEDDFYIMIGPGHSMWSGLYTLAHGDRQFSYSGGPYPGISDVFTYDAVTKQIIQKSSSIPVQVSSNPFVNTYTDGNALECTITDAGVITCINPAALDQSAYSCDGWWWMGTAESARGCSYGGEPLPLQAVKV